MTPTLIVTNAQIPTGDPRRPWATALAILEKKLAAIGSSAEIQKLARPSTRIIDAGGRVVPLPAGTTVGSDINVTVLANGEVVVDSVEEEPL
jgi:hypothetical protein